MTAPARYCLVSDFDGTFTRREFYELAVEKYLGPGVPDYWTEYSAGRISHFQALAGIFSHLRCSEPQIREIVARMEPDPGAPGHVLALQRAGWDTVLVSNGCQWYIEIVLENLGLAGCGVPVYACPGKFVEGRGLLMDPPVDSAHFRPEYGVDKRSFVLEAQQRYERVAFAGNGAPDYEAALAVPAELRYARGWLAARFDREGIPYQCFEGWGGVAGSLLAAAAGGLPGGETGVSS